MKIESFQQGPLQQVIPSYLYQQYSDDDDLQAFVSSFNTITQGYLDWFNQTPLAVYTMPSITGALLDWVGLGLYAIPRPTLSTFQSSSSGEYDTVAYNTIAYDSLKNTSSGTAQIASDDIYKRVMTWNLYRGDGSVFNAQWVKNRVARFINGTGGMDADVLNKPPSVVFSGTDITVTATADSVYSALQLAYANGALSFPFMYSLYFQ